MSAAPEYRSFYVAIFQSPEFQGFSAHAQLLVFHLIGRLGMSGIDEMHAGVLSPYMNLSTDEVEAAAEELESVGWLERERMVWWLVAKLAHEPGYDWKNKKDKRSISVARHLAKLRFSDIVRRFAERYEFDFPEERPRRPILHASSDQAAARPDTATTEDALMGLVRRSLYIDGEPAPEWDPGRDRLIMRDLLKAGLGLEALGEAIVGLGLMRDRGDSRLARPGTPLTLRPLWDGKRVTDAVRMAREYYAQANRSQLADGSALQAVLDEIAGTGRAA